MIFLFNLPVHSACFWPVRFAGLLSTGGLSRWASGNGGKDAFDRAPKATSEAGTLPITVSKGTSEASGVGTSPNDSPSPPILSRWERENHRPMPAVPKCRHIFHTPDILPYPLENP